MEPRYDPNKYEEEIYNLWENKKYFCPKIDRNKKPFTILLPPPNANASLHLGHALYTVEDVLIRWHRMRGEPTLWLPGTDHAGIETQFVFEKELEKQGKSRFDFDRTSLYQEIETYVKKQKGKIQKQLRLMGFSLDWTREKYTLDPESIKLVYSTFERLHKDKLVYRAKKLVNYCTRCGTSFSSLEIKYKEIKDQLYYLDYKTIQIATVRPETIFADVAVAVNPKDLRYKKLIGKTAVVPLIDKEIPIIEDEAVLKDFGTGALKITPGHDDTDAQIGQRHNLDTLVTIDFDGRLNKLAGKYKGMEILDARKAVISDLKKKGKIVKIENYKHSVACCYRCGTIIEPLPLPQWFVATKQLAKPAVEAVKSGRIKIVPKRFYKIFYQWMENILDWNISRQIVWGIRIPVWYSVSKNPNLLVAFKGKDGKVQQGQISNILVKYPFEQIEKGLQNLIAPQNAKYVVSIEKPGDDFLQETDTFDTWFSSSQWPQIALGYPKAPDFEYFYPTSVLDTMWDILFFWVARMIMFSLYLTDNIPFEVVHLHSMVTDEKGQKMSKSRGNVIDPIEIVKRYGADALRMALLIGAAPGNPIRLSENKIIGMRNFTNKVWNIARFILSINNPSSHNNPNFHSTQNEDDKWILAELSKTIHSVDKSLSLFRLSDAGLKIYEFIWHKFADKYLENIKNRRAEARPTLLYVLQESLKLLHPFMPFVTETIWQIAKKQKTGFFKEEALTIASWPRSVDP